MNKIAIYIPTYRCRYDKILNYINNFDKRFDVYVVFSTYDEHINDYDKIDLSNATKLYCDAKTIGGKRQFTIDYLYNKGYKYALQIEDDVRPIASKITEETKRTTSNSYAKLKIDINELLIKMTDTIIDNNACFVSPSFPFNLGFSTPGAISINKSLNFGQCHIIDLEQVFNNNIKYDTRENVHDDIDIVLQMIQHGLTCITLKDYSFELIPSSSLSENSTICNGNKQDIMRINLYLKYRDGISLRIGKHGELRLTCKLDKYYNTLDIPIKNDAYHQCLYELCKDYNIEEIKKLIKNKFL